MTNRSKQASKTKSKIYKCGIELIQTYGYEKITVNDVAKKANISVGTFYHYFNSKFDLLVEIFHQGDEFFKENSEKIINSNRTVSEKIIEYFKLYAELSIRDGVAKVSNLYVTSNNMFLTHGRLMQDLLKEVIVKGQSNNEIISTVSPEKITEDLFIVARGVIFDWCLHKGENDLLENMNNLINRVTRSYVNDSIFYKEN